jgi:hypothetical protein
MAPNAEAGDHGTPARSIKPDVCEYTSRDWSAMRAALIALSKFTGKTDSGVQTIARQALDGSPEYSIGEFELRYARASTGSACFPKQITFHAVRNDGEDAAYRCEAILDVQGKARSISCDLVAG